jgi:phosphoserine aminotransferase
MLRYSTHAEANSLFNTPNTFGVLVLKLVLEWVREQGGVEAIGERNRRKADKLYECIDNSRIYRAHAQPGSRSLMNITWTLGDLGDPKTRERTSRFLAAAEGEGMSGLKGHRSVGGCRASIYNAFPETGVDALLEFMQRFERDLNERSR